MWLWQSHISVGGAQYCEWGVCGALGRSIKHNMHVATQSIARKGESIMVCDESIVRRDRLVMAMRRRKENMAMRRRKENTAKKDKLLMACDKMHSKEGRKKG